MNDISAGARRTDIHDQALRKGDKVRVSFEGWEGTGRFVQHLKRGQRDGAWDWCVGEEAHCLIAVKGQPLCCVPTRCVTSC